MTMDARGVLAALENDLIRDEFRPAGLFIPEVQAPGSDRRADLIWMTARTAHITGYEVKVTRQDLLSELRDPTKCEPWLKYCDRWWLAVGDASLVDGLMDRIPDDWGVCTPPTSPNRRMMTVLKEAPVLTPADKGPVLGKLISHQAYRNMELQRRVRNAESTRDMERERQEKRDDWHVQELRRKANPYEDKFREVGEAYEKLNAEMDMYGRLQHVDAEEIAQAIFHAREITKLRDGMARAAEAQLRNIERAVEGITGSYGWKNLTETLKGMLNDDD